MTELTELIPTERELIAEAAWKVKNDLRGVWRGHIHRSISQIDPDLFPARERPEAFQESLVILRYYTEQFSHFASAFLDTPLEDGKTLEGFLFGPLGVDAQSTVRVSRELLRLVVVTSDNLMASSPGSITLPPVPRDAFPATSTVNAWRERLSFFASKRALPGLPFAMATMHWRCDGTSSLLEEFQSLDGIGVVTGAMTQLAESLIHLQGTGAFIMSRFRYLSDLGE